VSPSRLQSLLLIQSATKTQFTSLELLDQAFTHRSYAHESPSLEGDNERLEFLGDSILGLVVAEYLYQAFPKATEGTLAKLKGKLVSTPVLAKLSGLYGFPEVLLLSKGEGRQGRKNPNIQADSFEAFLGALYLDQGKEACQAFLLPHLQKNHDLLESLESTRDHKSLVQEYCQKRWKQVPTYQVLQESGPDHKKEFLVQITHPQGLSYLGRGTNKKQAEQEAARQACLDLGIE